MAQHAVVNDKWKIRIAPFHNTGRYKVHVRPPKSRHWIAPPMLLTTQEKAFQAGFAYVELWSDNRAPKDERDWVDYHMFKALESGIE